MRIWQLLLLLPLCLGGCQRRQVERPPKAVAIREDGAIALRLVTFNIRYEGPEDVGQLNWHVRSVAMVRSLVRMDPDIFAIQEGLHGQVADLRASLPDYDFSGVGRDDGKAAGEYTGIFFRRDRFAPDWDDAGTFWLSGTPEIPGSMTWGNRFPRIAAWLRLTDRATGRGFYVFATHWDHQNQPSRESAAKLIGERIDARHHPDEPVALLGDFNATQGNSAMAYLRGQTSLPPASPVVWKNGLTDVFSAVHHGDGGLTTLHLWHAKIAAVVDHILVSKGARLLSADIVKDPEPYPSDHFPVVAEVEFPLPGGPSVNR